MTGEEEGTGQGTVTAVSFTTSQESLVKRDQITWAGPFYGRQYKTARNGANARLKLRGFKSESALPPCFT